ncbi:hypothetical protein [Billgrantia aerodenitrificans]|uniref:Zinc chelation protein SecC n=1 Tax=Billgrantia aerodenitrificans TaxID=2733483 RepID=A0ABS9API5_9GAMM|nr:hypothetical protein [Halomonas aerodenitrificans]MCE8023655.1 zinc chelation protein SecC [Halomonas aerodenitrificans]
MRVPGIREPYVRRFCWDVVRGSEPRHVRHEPLPGAPTMECFSIVPEQVARFGGEQVLGWAIFEWRKVMIEAEFHTVWRNPNGDLVDLTPRPIPLRKILFLPDPNRRYEGRQVDNVRKPLVNDPRIRRFIQLAERLTALLNEGDLADQYGEIPATPEMRDVQNEMGQLQLALAERYGRP